MFLFEVLSFFPMLNISYNSCHWKIQKLSGKRMHLSSKSLQNTCREFNLLKINHRRYFSKILTSKMTYSNDFCLRKKSFVAKSQNWCPLIISTSVKAVFILAMNGHNSWTLDAKVGRWTLDSGRKTLETGRWTLDAGLWTLDSGCWTLDAGSWTLHSRGWTLDATLWTLGSGSWTLSLTVLEQNQKPVSDSAWLNYWKFFGCQSLRTSWSHLLYRDYRFWLGYF